jgi:hypothetical protein
MNEFNWFWKLFIQCSISPIKWNFHSIKFLNIFTIEISGKIDNIIEPFTMFPWKIVSHYANEIQKSGKFKKRTTYPCVWRLETLHAERVERRVAGCEGGHVSGQGGHHRRDRRKHRRDHVGRRCTGHERRVRDRVWHGCHDRHLEQEAKRGIFKFQFNRLVYLVLTWLTTQIKSKFM